MLTWSLSLSLCLNYSTSKLVNELSTSHSASTVQWRPSVWQNCSVNKWKHGCSLCLLEKGLMEQSVFQLQCRTCRWFSMCRVKTNASLGAKLGPVPPAWGRQTQTDSPDAGHSLLLLLLLLLAANFRCIYEPFYGPTLATLSARVTLLSTVCCHWVEVSIQQKKIGQPFVQCLPGVGVVWQTQADHITTPSAHCWNVFAFAAESTSMFAS